MGRYSLFEEKSETARSRARMMGGVEDMRLDVLWGQLEELKKGLGNFA